MPSTTKGTAVTRNRSLTFLAGAAVIALVALAVAGCGGGATGGSATIGVATTGLGSTLVDSTGRTLYLFQKDAGTRSACAGACATDWPPLRASGKPTLGSGVNPALVSTTTRSDGAAQVTYNGHPLYPTRATRSPATPPARASRRLARSGTRSARRATRSPPSRRI